MSYSLPEMESIMRCYYYPAILSVFILLVSCVNQPAEDDGVRTMTVSSSSGGQITPSVKTFKGSKTFYFEPVEGYIVYDIRMNGVSLGAVNSVNFNPVSSGDTVHDTIDALFMPTPVAHWSFDSSKKNIYYDISGNGNDAVDSNKADLQLVEGVKGDAIHLSGDEFHIKVPGSKNKFDFPRFSLALWFRSDSSFFAPARWENLKKLFQYSSSQKGYMVGVDWDGLLAFAVDGPQSNDDWLRIKDTLIENTWYYCVITCDNRDVNVYLNGKRDTTKLMRQIELCDIDLAIGCSAIDDIMCLFKGYIDELRLFDTVLDSAFIAAEYECMKPEER